MACSPKRPDPLRDAEARVRALTREVGTLREDLRRETKKRERAVAQAKENEESRRTSDARCQELAYSNRKLASELDTLHETARAAAERDRRALRSLREGLAAVEEAVAARARKGFVQIQVLHDVQQQLRQLLFGSTGGAGPIGADSFAASSGGGSTAAGSILSGAAASRAQQLLAAAQMHVQQLASLLTGGDNDDTSAGGSSGGVAASFDGREGGAMGLELMLPGSRQGSGPGGGGVDLEKEQLQQEVMRLRAELRTQEDRSGPSSFTAMELQQSLREAQAELVRLRAEMVHLNAAAAAAAREQQATAEALEEAHRRLQQQDELHAALVTSVREQEDSNQGLVTELTARRVELEGEVSNLSQRLGTLQQQVSELLEERQGMQELLRQREEDRRSLEELLQHREEELRAAKASILEQGADIRNALSLISRPPGHGQAVTYPLTAATAAAAPPAAIAPTPAERAGALSACLALPRSASAPPPTATAAVAPTLDSALAAALAPYHNASAAIGSALAAAAAIIPPTGMPQPQPSPPLGSSAGSTGAGSWLQPATAAAANGSSVLGHIQPSPQLQSTLSSAHLTPSQVLQQLQNQRSQAPSQYPHKKTLHQQQTAAPVRQQQALADLTALLGLGPPHRGRVVSSGTDSVAPSARGVYPPVVGGQTLGNASGGIGTQRMLPPRAASVRDGSTGGPGAPLGDAAWRQGARRMVGGEGLLLHAMQVSSNKAQGGEG
ncbi:hypothetical protein Vafri_11431, partial [Volvox africanus]